MAYTSDQRRDAALRGWETRRKQLPDYSAGMARLPAASSTGEADLASELPVTRIFDAGNIASWEDNVYDVDPDGYRTMHTCLPLIKSVEKRGTRIAKLNWTVLGSPARAAAVAEIVKQAHCFTDMIKWLTWADIDGVRYMQIKGKQAREGSGSWIVPDFFMGGRRKYKAGGDIQWDGTRLVQVKQTTGVASVEAKKLPDWQFIIHRPGAGSNPEGDLSLGIACYKAARSYEEACKNIDAYMELFGVPIRVFKGNMDKVRPDQLATVLTNQAERLKMLKQNKQIVLTDEQMLELIEPKGQGFKDLIEYNRYIEALFDQLFLANQLTSSVQDANRTGNTQVHLTEESEAIYCGAMQIAEALNRHLIPWIIRKNPDLPPLADGQSEVYLWPEPPVESTQDDDQDVDSTGDENGEPTENDAGTADPAREQEGQADGTGY